MGIQDLQLSLLSVFREFFVHHHRSLEFRAKLFAAIIAANGDEIDEKVYEKLKKIGMEIYGHDAKRIAILVRITKEYVKKIITKNELNLDELIKDLEYTLRKIRRYAKKINLNHLRRIQNQDNEDVKIIQQRIIEFAELRIEQYEQEEEEKRAKKERKKLKKLNKHQHIQKEAPKEKSESKEQKSESDLEKQNEPLPQT